MEDKYIGSRKVMGVTEIELKTVAENPIVEVLFENGDKKIMSKKTFDIVATSEVSDETTVSNKKLDAIISGCLAVIEEFDADVMEWNKITIRLYDSLNENLNRATNLLWYKDDKRFVPGVDSLNNVSLLMVKKVINDRSKE